MGSVAGSWIALRPKSRHWRRPWNWVLGPACEKSGVHAPSGKGLCRKSWLLPERRPAFPSCSDRRMCFSATGKTPRGTRECGVHRIGGCGCPCGCGNERCVTLRCSYAMVWRADILRSGQMVRECLAGTSRTSHKQLNCHFRESGNDPHDIPNCPDETPGPPPELGRCLRTDCCAYVTRRDTVTMLHNYGYSDSLYV